MTGPTFHSYQGQDRFIIAASGEQRGGFFIDSGASDGVSGSNTRTLETQFGWQGICIEPNDTLYRRLSANRECICLNCCLYDHDGPVDFLEVAEVYGGILSEYDPAHLRFAQAAATRNCPHAPTPVTKTARTIGSILAEYKAPTQIDYWSLDTEGSELAILRTFPFDKYRVRFITVEHNHSPAREEIAALLGEYGFRRVANLGIDDVYANVGTRPRPPWRSHALHRPQPHAQPQNRARP